MVQWYFPLIFPWFNILYFLLSDWFRISCMTTDNFCFYLQNRQIQTSQAGGQWYNDTFPFSIPWFNVVYFFVSLVWNQLYDNWHFLICKTVSSKQVKQEVNGTMILPPLVFPASMYFFYWTRCYAPLRPAWQQPWPGPASPSRQGLWLSGRRKPTRTSRAQML